MRAIVISKSLMCGTC